MQPNVSVLARKAIDAALKADWAASIEYNLLILQKEPKNIDAKNRLGRAYIQQKDFKKAEKLFEEVLKTDPINTIALKNLKLAKEKKIDSNGGTNLSAKSLIKEPGTTTQVTVNVTARGLNCDCFSPGEILKIKVKKRSAEVIKQKIKGEVIVGEISDPDVINRLNTACLKDSSISASFLKGVDKSITILVKCEVPVFKSERQDTKPYLKKGSIEEPELIIETETLAE